MQAGCANHLMKGWSARLSTREYILAASQTSSSPCFTIHHTLPSSRAKSLPPKFPDDYKLFDLEVRFRAAYSTTSFTSYGIAQGRPLTSLGTSATTSFLHLHRPILQEVYISSSSALYHSHTPAGKLASEIPSKRPTLSVSASCRLQLDVSMYVIQKKQVQPIYPPTSTMLYNQSRWKASLRIQPSGSGFLSTNPTVEAPINQRGPAKKVLHSRAAISQSASTLASFSFGRSVVSVYGGAEASV